MQPSLSTTLLLLNEVAGQLRREFHPSCLHIDLADEGVDQVASDGARVRPAETSDLLDRAKRGDSIPHSFMTNKHHVILDLLTVEDWDAVLYPVAELSPYLRSTTVPWDKQGGEERCGQASESSDVTRQMAASYVKCRVAELPMRLQVETLQLKRHENLLQQYMHELLLLSQHVSFDSSDASSLTDALDSSRASSHVAPPLSEAALKSGAEDMAPRRARCLARITELEQKVRYEARCKERCCQRMVLLCEMTRRLSLCHTDEAAVDGVPRDSEPTGKRRRIE